MPTGSIISFKEDKGYGFIRPQDGGNNVYLHISALQAAGINSITAGQRLSYDVSSETGKPAAINIQLLP